VSCMTSDPCQIAAPPRATGVTFVVADHGSGLIEGSIELTSGQEDRVERYTDLG